MKAIQAAAAHLIKGLKTFDHTVPTMKEVAGSPSKLVLFPRPGAASPLRPQDAASLQT